MGLFSTTHVHRHETINSGPSHITVEEKRAPTDESVKLLNEMQAAARKNIIDSVVIKDNLFNGAAIVYMVNPSMMECEVIMKFTINGRDFQYRYKIDRGELYTKSLRDNLKDVFVRHLSALLMHDLSKQYEEMLRKI